MRAEVEKYGGAPRLAERLPDLVQKAEKDRRLEDLRGLSGLSETDQKKVFLTAMALGGSDLGNSELGSQLAGLPHALDLLNRAGASSEEAAPLKRILEPFAVPEREGNAPVFLYKNHDRVLAVAYDPAAKQFRINDYVAGQDGVRRTEYVVRIETDRSLVVSQKHLSYPNKTADEAYAQHSSERLITSAKQGLAAGMQ